MSRSRSIMKRPAVPELPKDTAYHRILRFYTNGDVPLSEDDHAILKRWNHTHSLILQRKHTEDQIVEEIATLFGVSRYTAKNDFYNAMNLYAGVMRINKKFLLYQHAQYTMQLVELYKNDKDWAGNVPKLMDTYTKTIMAIPDEMAKEDIPPPQINFFVVAGQKVEQIDDMEGVVERLSKPHSSSPEGGKERKEMGEEIEDVDWEDAEGEI